MMRLLIITATFTTFISTSAHAEVEKFLCMGEWHGQFSGTLTIYEPESYDGSEQGLHMHIIGRRIKEGKSSNVIRSMRIVSDGEWRTIGHQEMKFQNSQFPRFRSWSFNRKFTNLRVEDIMYYDDFTSNTRAFTLECAHSD